MALTDEIAQLATVVPEIVTDIETLITLAQAAAAGTATPDELTQLQGFADALNAAHTAAQAVGNPAPAPTPPANVDAATGFVWKEAGESFTDSQTRLVDYNAANPDNQVQEANFLSEAAWNSIVL